MWDNVATKEKNSKRPKIRRSITHSVRKTHWEDKDSRGKRLYVGEATTLKLLGDSRDSTKINQWKDLVEDKRKNLQGKLVDQNKAEILDPSQENGDFTEEMRTQTQPGKK